MTLAKCVAEQFVNVPHVQLFMVAHLLSKRGSKLCLSKLCSPTV
mgnify:CR=1 FL=1